MAQVVLATGGFLATMLFVMVALLYELDLSVVIAAMLSVSTVAVGVLVAAVTQHLFGLSMRWTAFSMAGLVFLMAGLYETVS